MKRLYLISYIPSNEKDRVDLQVNEIKDVIEICSLLTRLNESFSITRFGKLDKLQNVVIMKVDASEKLFENQVLLKSCKNVYV